MRVGDTLVINIDKTMPNFTSDFTHKTEFPTEKLFNFEEWRFYNNYMTVVKDDENVDLLGNKKCFAMNANFQIVILATYKSDADIVKLCSTIPHAEKMHKILILPEEKDTSLPGAKNALKALNRPEAFFVKTETASKDYSQI